MNKLNQMPGHMLQADLDDLHQRGQEAWKSLESRFKAYERRQARKRFFQNLWNMFWKSS